MFFMRSPVTILNVAILNVLFRFSCPLRWDWDCSWHSNMRYNSRYIIETWVSLTLLCKI